MVNMFGRYLKQPIASPEMMWKFEWEEISTLSEEDEEFLRKAFPDNFGSR